MNIFSLHKDFCISSSVLRDTAALWGAVMREYILEVLPNNNIKLKITTDKPECIN